MKKLISIIVLAALAASLSGQGNRKLNRNQTLNPLSGFVNITELVGGPGIAITDVPFSRFIAGITTVNGYQINEYLIAGVGTGIHFYNEGFLVPLYLSGRLTYPIDGSKISPYANGDLGIQFNFQGAEDNTWTFINPMIGARYTLSSILAVDLGAGLFTQLNSKEARDSFINFKLGLVYIPKR